MLHKLPGAGFTVYDYSQRLDGLSDSDVLKFLLEDHCSVVVRTSDTGLKLKMYISASAENSEAVKAGVVWLSMVSITIRYQCI